MNVPDAAIEAAKQGLRGHMGPLLEPCCIRAAIEAAMPAIREALAQEIEAEAGKPDRNRSYVLGLEDAARIVRGGTP